MAYIGFDLDETIGHFNAISYHSYFLSPYSAYNNVPEWAGREPFLLSNNLKERLENAQVSFGNLVASAEMREKPLGLLRPGIIHLFNRLSELKDEGKVKGIGIYSNNAIVANLRIAASMIESILLKGELFDGLVERHNPLRTENVGSIKTISTLKKLFQTQTDIRKESLFFFDDLYHSDIASAIGDRYFQVNPYKSDPERYKGDLEEYYERTDDFQDPHTDPEISNFAFLNQCFYKAMTEEMLFNDKEYIAYLQPLFTKISPGNPVGFNTIMSVLHYSADHYSPSIQPFQNDMADILNKLDTMFMPAKQMGGKRRFNRKTKKSRRRKTRIHRISQK